jgi:hypothetical protein
MSPGTKADSTIGFEAGVNNDEQISIDDAAFEYSDGTNCPISSCSLHLAGNCGG